MPTNFRPRSRSTAWTFAYRYASVPFELELAVEEVAPRITVDSLVEARLEPEKLTLDLTAFYTIERAGVFKLELDVPEGFEVRSVTGRPVAIRTTGHRPTAYVRGRGRFAIISRARRRTTSS